MDRNGIEDEAGELWLLQHSSIVISPTNISGVTLLLLAAIDITAAP